MTRHAILLLLVFCTLCKQQNKTELPKRDSNSKPEGLTASYTPTGIIDPVAHEKYAVDTMESVVTWKGSMLLAANRGHTGYVYLSNGVLLIQKDRLVGGTVEVDMNTIADEKHGRNNGLVRHLKSPDFFDAKVFPFSTFTITKVAWAVGENITVTGDLTIKDITYPVTFPAKVEVKDGVVNANGKVTIDRTQWGVRYRSGAFYATLADEAISDSIEFDMKIVAKK